jgi:hypothetical protein
MWRLSLRDCLPSLTLGALLLLASSASAHTNAHPVHLMWWSEADGGPGYWYRFSLQLEYPWVGLVDHVVLGDVGLDAPAGAQTFTNLDTPSFDLPPPFDQLSYATTDHQGPMLVDLTGDGWSPLGVGDRLVWEARADNLMDPEAFYWSFTEGGPTVADYELAILSCTLAPRPPPATLQDGVCAGAVQICDPWRHEFFDPDFAVIDGYEFFEVSCDGLDNDCDGLVDEFLYPDADGDGHSPPGSCGGIPDDCDDNEASVHPGQPETLCDGLDNDCDPTTEDDPSDMDGDGYSAPTDPCGSQDDCNDNHADVYPGRQEILCDGLDNDCDPATIDQPDNDGDGVSVCLDCNDADPNRAPGLPEICDDKDTDCDGRLDPTELDLDQDSWSLCEGDCDDHRPSVNPGAIERCGNGADDNCDSIIDDHCPRTARGCAHAGPAPDGLLGLGLLAVAMIRRRNSPR